MDGSVLTNRSARQRRKSDFYPTPEECTQAFIDYMALWRGNVIWEPACGDGHISKCFQKNGYKVISTDINSYGFEDAVEDFLESKGRECDWIITNPPFSLSEQFIRKCLELHKPFALLLKSQYWHSKKRLSLFNQHRPALILPLTWRPDFEFGARGGSPTMECMWVVWVDAPAILTRYIPLPKPKTIHKEKENV